MLQLINRLTNSVTMYVLTIGTLIGLLVVAYFASLFGGLAYTPLELTISVLALSGASLGVNALLAKAYGVAANHQSAVITALILAFVLSPTLSISGIVGLGFIAAASQASKYLLAVKGRHIFNPSAVGIVVAAYSGLAFASWWVATPILVVPTIIAGIFVLQKMRLLGLGAAFAFATIAIITLRTVGTGSGIDAALLLAVTSWPVLFFTVYMLSEPTTLAPRQWQRFSIAGVIAILFAAPVTIGFVTTTPAVALLIGNLIAFFHGQRRGITLTLQKVSQLSPSVKEYTFTAPFVLRYQAGQYIELTVPQKHPDVRGLRRSFSLVSAPGSKQVSIAVKFPPSGSSYKHALHDLQVDAHITGTSIRGDFVLPQNSAQKLLLVAGGIGITPFISYARHLRSTGEKRDITLLYFVALPEELVYVDDVSDFTVHTVTDNSHLTSELLTTVVPDASNRLAYVSGPPGMVDSVTKIMKNSGVKKVMTDYFSGY